MLKSLIEQLLFEDELLRRSLNNLNNIAQAVLLGRLDRRGSKAQVDHLRNVALCLVIYVNLRIPLLDDQLFGRMQRGPLVRRLTWHQNVVISLVFDIEL